MIELEDAVMEIIVNAGQSRSLCLKRCMRPEPEISTKRAYS